MATTTTRNARGRSQRGQARAAMEIQRKKVKLQEDHLTALFTHLEDIEQARLQAGEQVSELRGLGLTLGEIAELTGEPANRLSWLSRLTSSEDENPEATDEGSGEDSDPAEASVDENVSEVGEGSPTTDEDLTRSTVGK